VEAETGPAMSDVLSWFWRRRLSLVIGVIVGLVLAATYYKIATPKYSAEIIVMPQDDSESEGRLSGLLGNLGGVGALLGVGLGGESAARRNLAVFKSRAFTEQFIRAKGMMPALFEERWDATAKKWKEDGKDPPTLAEGVRAFEKIRGFAEDRRVGLVTVSISWKNAQTAAGWANEYVAFANQLLREQAITESETTMRYLDAQIGTTQAVGVREALYRVLESQMKTMTLARTRTDYAFRVIDPAQPPLKRDRVSPKLLPSAFTGIIGGALLGLLVGMVLPRLRRRVP